LLDEDSLRAGVLRPNTLVRYRGMVQNTLEPEYYTEAMVEVTPAGEAGGAAGVCSGVLCSIDRMARPALATPCVRAVRPHRLHALTMSLARDFAGLDVIRDVCPRVRCCACGERVVGEHPVCVSSRLLVQG
jgi:hypothetical protein